MKTIHLIRHSKSSWAIDGIEDCDRPLKGRGIRDAQMMSQFLKNEISDAHELLWCTSPAIRALHTAFIFARTLGVQENKVCINYALYACDASEMLHFLQMTSEDHNAVIIFAHNPAITQVVNQITNARINNVPTSGMVSIRFECENWKGIAAGAELIQFQYPKGITR